MPKPVIPTNAFAAGNSCFTNSLVQKLQNSAKQNSGRVCRFSMEGSCRDFALLEICILMQEGQEFDTGFMISSWNSAWGDVNIPVIDQGYRVLVQSGSIATN